MNKSIKATMVLLPVLLLSACIFGSDESNDDETAALAIIAAAAANSDSSNATLNITNNNGAAQTITVHLSDGSGLCSKTASADLGSVANGATATATVTANSSGYDIKIGGNCSAVGTGTTVKTYTCTIANGSQEAICN